MKNTKFIEGLQAGKNFERAMVALFRAPKPKLKKKLKKKGKD
jgi:hypothetical protein